MIRDEKGKKLTVGYNKQKKLSGHVVPVVHTTVENRIKLWLIDDFLVVSLLAMSL